MISIVVGALETILKGLEDLEISGQKETIQTITLLRLTRILEESWRLEETCCYSDSSEKPSANTGVKDSQKSK